LSFVVNLLLRVLIRNGRITGKSINTTLSGLTVYSIFRAGV